MSDSDSEDIIPSASGDEHQSEDDLDIFDPVPKIISKAPQDIQDDLWEFTMEIHQRCGRDAMTEDKRKTFIQWSPPILSAMCFQQTGEAPVTKRDFLSMPKDEEMPSEAKPKLVNLPSVTFSVSGTNYNPQTIQDGVVKFEQALLEESKAFVAVHGAEPEDLNMQKHEARLIVHNLFNNAVAGIPQRLAALTDHFSYAGQAKSRDAHIKRAPKAIQEFLRMSETVHKAALLANSIVTTTQHMYLTYHLVAEYKKIQEGAQGEPELLAAVRKWLELSQFQAVTRGQLKKYLVFQSRSIGEPIDLAIPNVKFMRAMIQRFGPGALIFHWSGKSSFRNAMPRANAFLPVIMRAIDNDPFMTNLFKTLAHKSFQLVIKSLTTQNTKPIKTGGVPYLLKRGPKKSSAINQVNAAVDLFAPYVEPDSDDEMEG